MTGKHILREIERALKKERYATVLELATQLLNAGPEWKIDGYLFRGVAYENGGEDLAQDLNKAIQDYRQLTVIAPTGVAYQYLARALMSQGQENYPAAFRYLQEGYKLRNRPGLILGFAEYYKTKEAPELEIARNYYLRAALHGRFMGFFGYAEISRALGQPIRAIAADCIRLCTGPFLALMLGSTARERF